jgi:SAM-dependent methyltransferase
MDAATQQGSAAQRFYDERYKSGYMQDFLDLYEACRVVTVRNTLRSLPVEPGQVLDYGCGEGRYLEILGERFPDAGLVGSDISRVALEHVRERQPGARVVQMQDERVPEPDRSFGVVLSVEVLEHVSNVESAVSEIGRLLAPGGWAVITTPCANPGSPEWIANRLRGGLQSTPDGYGRFASDEPGHLRRLTSRDLRVLLSRAGLEVERVDFRAQLFTPMMAWAPGRVSRRLGPDLMTKIGLLDWMLLRRLPTGATMVAVAQRPR